MNQLEFFVASTECSRSEVRRYLRQLRELDELIEYHLDCLRYITEQRVQQLATDDDAREAGSDAIRDSVGRVKEEDGEPSHHKRRRASPVSRASVATRTAKERRLREDGDALRSSTAPTVRRPELLAALELCTPSSVRSGLVDPSQVPLTKLPPDQMRAAYMFHRTRALRHAEERKAIAAELAERGAELKGAMSVRLAQFEQGVEEDSER